MSTNITSVIRSRPMVLDELKVILKAETAQYTSELNKAKAQT